LRYILTFIETLIDITSQTEFIDIILIFYNHLFPLLRQIFESLFSILPRLNEKLTDSGMRIFH
jgi:hypothetical protein